MGPLFSVAIVGLFGCVAFAIAFVVARLIGLSLSASAWCAVAFVAGAFIGGVAVAFIGAAIVGFGAELESGIGYLGSTAVGAAIGGALAVHCARRMLARARTSKV